LEQRITPGDEIVEIRHYCLQHVGRRTKLGHRPRLERVLLPFGNAIDRRLVKFWVLRLGKINEDILNQPHVIVLEGLNFPETFRGGSRTVVSGIEYIMEPLLSIAEFLVLTQVDAN